MGILFSIIAVLCVFGFLEFQAHRKNIKRIPIRIHVNGTRGKSSVTRLIAAGLRGGGIRTLAKSSGTAAAIIYPDGHEELIARRGNANIIEQLEIFEVARDEKAEAVVIECMAIRPDFQKLCEEKIVRSTHGVITNVRADHLDVMGPRIQDVAEALSGTLPEEGEAVFTAESEGVMRDILAANAARHNKRLIHIYPDSVTDSMMSGFPYLEHRENVALALEVSRCFGISEDRSLKAMHNAKPDPGVLQVYHFKIFGKKIEFINAFSANDPDSILSIWIRMSRKFSEGQTRLILLNTRKERLQRSHQLAECIAKHLECEYIFLTGDDQHVVKRFLLKYLKGSSRVVECGRKHPRLVFRSIFRRCGLKASIFAIGNIGGAGQEYVQFFKRISEKHKCSKETFFANG